MPDTDPKQKTRIDDKAFLLPITVDDSGSQVFLELKNGPGEKGPGGIDYETMTLSLALAKNVDDAAHDKSPEAITVDDPVFKNLGIDTKTILKAVQSQVVKLGFAGGSFSDTPENPFISFRNDRLRTHPDKLAALLDSQDFQEGVMERLTGSIQNSTSQTGVVHKPVAEMSHEEKQKALKQLLEKLKPQSRKGQASDGPYI